MMLKDTKFLKRLIISYSALLIVILIMGVNLYSISISNVSNEIRNQNKFMLEKAIHDMNTSFKTMDVLAGQVVTNSHIVQLANKEDNSENDFYLLAYHAREELSVYVFTESILPITTSFIYLNNPDYILSFSQFQNTRIYYNGTKKYLKDKYEDWLDMMNDETLYRQFNPLDPYKKHSDSAFLYILPLHEYSIKEVPATICFEIDYQRIGQIFNELNFYDTGFLCVTDASGNTVFTLKGDNSGDINADKLSELNYKNNFSKYNRNDNPMFVTNAVSEYNDWNYYLVQPEDASLYSLKQFRDIFIMIILCAFIIEFVMIFILSKTNVKPIIKLGNELQDTLTMKKSLQEIVETQKPIIKQSYLAKIIQGGISTPEEMGYAQNYLNIVTENRKFSVLSMIIYINQYELYIEDSAVTGPDTINYRDIIQLAVEQFFGQPAYLHGSAEREYYILISSPAEEAGQVSTSHVKDAFILLHEYLLDNYNIWAFAGFSDWNTGLMITWRSYQQASQAITYATKQNIFHCYSNIEREANGFYYPIELIQHLTKFITSGNKSQVLEIFDIIRHENMEERALPVNMIKFLLSDIRNTLFKIRFTLKNTERNEESLKTIDALFNQHMSLKLCEDIAMILCELFDTNSCGNQLIVNIKEYINENYKDPSLCLNKISDEFSISESYFSYLFKEETGENFSCYLERIRMEQALRLLNETDINISLLFQEVGYNNGHSFRRAFKKTYGVPPKASRHTLSSPVL